MRAPQAVGAAGVVHDGGATVNRSEDRPWGLLAWFTMAGPDVHTETVSFAALLTLGAHPALACRVANGTTAYRN